MFFLGVGDVEYAWRIFFLGGSCEPPVIKKCPFGPYHRCYMGKFDQNAN